MPGAPFSRRVLLGGADGMLRSATPRHEEAAMPRTGDVRKVEGDWQEFVNGQWYPWNERPLCSCTVEDDGDGESGPHLTIVERDPDCARHLA